MKWSSASTSKRAVLFTGLCLGMLGGCAHPPPLAPPPIRGSVNLDQLVRRHPGWSGVSQYDEALRRLAEAARSLPQGAQPDQRMATLPALPAAAPVPAETPNLNQTEQRLDSVQQSLLSSLQARRQAARLDEVHQQQDIWRREARTRFVVAPEKTSGAPDFEIQLLQANVETLTRTVANLEAVFAARPPSERLAGKGLLLSKSGSRSCWAERDRQRIAAQTKRMDERQNVRDDRAAYVQAQADSLTTRLQDDDARLVAAQSARLTRQRLTLLADLAQPPVAAVPPTGFAGAETLPHGPGIAQASLSQASLTASEDRLRTQRARWIKFLRDDTQAAAQDMAAKQNWNVTFGPPRPGDRDLTTAMTQAMLPSIWRR